ncbi:dTDP-4-dehydrorhamnose reductase [Flaviaesturariibacter flavus]|uniref:dTDP-4-dehydrorhamnose reductase n=1 Tax=Flaviaesturariibacter flavus TaxID=2502780 RepID=A0A4R1BJZ4_9BACT|nr:dTDP-4-dehydrorhamnose reductase [Flaviaesturariibacter flavus]TCJ17643.1 dTDP-4-dehydrorhamnose reductase [Flaviaesturariibacter flavus]
MKILVTGAGGQLSSELTALASEFPQFEILALPVDALDITDRHQVAAVFERERPGACINAAAYTAVDKAEQDRDTAYAVNAYATGILAGACAAAGARFIHVSTDYVFDGQGTRPYREDDPTGPLGVYGASKLKGEELCFAADPSAIVVRTAWVFSSYGNNFVKTMLRLMGERPALSIVNDQHGCPTYAADLARTVLQILAGDKWVPGTYHFSNAGETTWYRFAEAIRDKAGLSCALQPITTDQYPTPAKRPAWSVLDTTKIRTTYGLHIRGWEECLDDCLEKLQVRQSK